MNECSGAREPSKQQKASKLVNGLSELANGRASGPVLQSVFLIVLAHCVIVVVVIFISIIIVVARE